MVTVTSMCDGTVEIENDEYIGDYDTIHIRFDQVEDLIDKLRQVLNEV